MSHEMTELDRMFSVREAPWHEGTGTNVSVLADYPGRDEAMTAAGLNWAVEEQDVYRRRVQRVLDPSDDGNGTRETFTFPKLPGWKMLLRSDNGELLHVAKDSYGVVQNSVGFDIIELLLDADEAIRFETGGSVKSGAACYITARVDEPTVIDGDDSPTFPYVVVTWAHDGSAAVQARATNIRVVCWNTLSASEAQAERTGRRFTFRHTKNVMTRIEDAKAALSGVRAEHATFVELANELANTPVTDVQREQFVTTFVPRPEADIISDTVLDNIMRARRQVRELFDGPTIPEAHRNTAYGLVLAGGEYLDHIRASRSSGTYVGRTILRDEPMKAKLIPMVRKLVNA